MYRKSLADLIVEKALEIKSGGASGGSYSGSSKNTIFDNAEKKRKAREYISQAKLIRRFLYAPIN